MPLTQLQAETNNIKNSILWFINNNVKSSYDTRAAATSSAAEIYTSPLRVVIGKPDDPDIENNPPVVAIDDVNSTERDRFYELGTNNLYRHFNFSLCCYPSLTSTGLPSLSARYLLESLMRNAMSAEYIRVVDFNNGSYNAYNTSSVPYCNDVMEVTNFSGPTPRGGNAVLAQQKHRFDMHLGVKVVVMEGLVS